MEGKTSSAPSSLPRTTRLTMSEGGAAHSFGKIPFKDRRGIDASVGGGKGGAGVCGEDGDWHEPRFIPFDEIEAAGAELIGKLEANVREWVSPRWHPISR